jgi:hypothetical protein
MMQAKKLIEVATPVKEIPAESVEIKILQLDYPLFINAGQEKTRIHPLKKWIH